MDQPLPIKSKCLESTLVSVRVKVHGSLAVGLALGALDLVPL